MGVAGRPEWRLPKPALALLVATLAGAPLPAVLSDGGLTGRGSGNLTGHEVAVVLLLCALSLAWTLAVVLGEPATGTHARRHFADPTYSWAFAAGLTLPPYLTTFVAAAVFALHRAGTAPRERLRPHAFVFRLSATVLAACAAGFVHTRVLPVLNNLGADVSAAVCFAVIVLAGLAAMPGRAADLPTGRGERRRAGLRVQPATLLRDSVIALGLGAVLATLVTADTALAWSALAGTLLVALLGRRSASADDPSDETAMSGRAWAVLAEEVVTACAQVSILRIDSDVEAARRAIGSVQDGCAIGLFGDAGLAAVLVDQADAGAVAARARLALLQAGIHAHLSVAAKPRDGQCLADLLAVTEAELIASDAATRSARSLRPDA